MKVIEMKLLDRYLQFFYIACGKPSKYMERNEQVTNAYWLISMLQGVNLISFLLLLFTYFSFGNLSKMILFGIFCFPLLINYYLLFLKKGRKNIIKRVDELLMSSKLKSKAYLIWYSALTIAWMVLSSIIYINSL